MCLLRAPVPVCSSRSSSGQVGARLLEGSELRSERLDELPLLRRTPLERGLVVLREDRLHLRRLEQRSELAESLLDLERSPNVVAACPLLARRTGQFLDGALKRRWRGIARFCQPLVDAEQRLIPARELIVRRLLAERAKLHLGIPGDGKRATHEDGKGAELCRRSLAKSRLSSGGSRGGRCAAGGLTSARLRSPSTLCTCATQLLFALLGVAR
mmetsp:Transcript_73138/g.145453  ORF Transcript_73138/g.145453 Transcript_73138/m.145453 type:complete len:214 (+) Transcript_73138:134-775(+)